MKRYYVMILLALMVILGQTAMAEEQSVVFELKDWSGSWINPSFKFSEMTIEEFDGELIFTSGEFKWKDRMDQRYDWDLTMQCTKKVISKDYSKLKLTTSGCKNADFDGKYAVCTKKSKTEFTCDGNFGSALFIESKVFWKMKMEELKEKENR